MIKAGVAVSLLCISMLVHAQKITEQQIQQAESVQPPPPPQPGQYSDDDDYFIAQAQLASYSIDTVEIGIRCKKAPPELTDHIFRLQVFRLYMAAVKSYGNEKGELSLKGDHQFSQSIKLINNKVDLLYMTRKSNPPSREQCNAVNEADYKKLVARMKAAIN